jgi:hypothetical protein
MLFFISLPLDFLHFRLEGCIFFNSQITYQNMESE